jgi:GNAT superfamily N-acetyltransferase
LPRLSIVSGFMPGALGRVVEMHGRYYAAAWGFGASFEAEVAAELAEFCRRYDPARDGIWLACRGERIVASVALDHAGEGGAARVRWFIAEPDQQGAGIGRRLFDDLLAFAEATGQRHLYLWTFAGLAAARRLYDRAGFLLTEESLDTGWGPPVLAQRLDRRR